MRPYTILPSKLIPSQARQEADSDFFKVGDDMLVMHLVNREFSDGVIFCRGPSTELGSLFA